MYDACGTIHQGYPPPPGDRILVFRPDGTDATPYFLSFCGDVCLEQLAKENIGKRFRATGRVQDLETGDRGLDVATLELLP